MADISKLLSATAALVANVDTFIKAHGPSDQPDVDKATASVQAVNDKVVAATPKPA